jgi:hypothetical protein
MADTAVIPSGEAWARVQNAVKKVEGGRAGLPVGETPTYHFPAVPYRTTGPAVDGFYPGYIIAWDEDAEDWVDTEECYIKAG